tara:strand:- start:1921 stop:2241 length:321 start_codon:yes stop_codon:yes gene_type:complete
MIRLTVLYNLAEDMNEEEFIQWRQETHQNYVESMPGVIRTEFSRITRSWPKDIAPKFRFQTIVDWPDVESFEKAFFNDSAQKKLKDDTEKIGDSLYIVSEVLSGQE